MPPSISVIIPFRDKANLTIRAVTSLLRTQDPLITEIILVDNDSAPKERAQISRCIQRLEKEFSTTFLLLTWKRPFNWQRINNFAARRAKGSVLCFLNNDVYFDRRSRGLFKTMTRKAFARRTGVVGCVMRYPDGSVQHGGGHPDRGFCHSHFGGAMRPAYRVNRLHKYLTGACHVIAAETFWKLGAYDSSYKMLGGDIDLCARAIQCGFKNWLIGSASLIHLESRTRRSKPADPSDFRKLFYSIMRIYLPNDGITIAKKQKKRGMSSLERYYGFTSRKLKELICNFSGRGLEFLPGIPHRRTARQLIFCDGLDKAAIDRLLSRIAGKRREILLVGSNLSNRLHTRWIRELNLDELQAQRRVFWIDTRLDDEISASRKMEGRVRRSFPLQKVRTIQN